WRGTAFALERKSRERQRGVRRLPQCHHQRLYSEPGINLVLTRILNTVTMRTWVLVTLFPSYQNGSASSTFCSFYQSVADFLLLALARLA
ncbi:MAG: hypothetical protein KDE54_18105, partial [Caldilineaceae bacterium]|nr:hypothetical protein [Caldilineaceae bacterium]